MKCTCNKCGVGGPCILVVSGKEPIPTVCPWSNPAEEVEIAEWKKSKKPAEFSD